MAITFQYIEVIDGKVNRVSKKEDGSVAYKVIGEATEPEVLKLDTFIDSKIKDVVQPLESFEDKNALEEYGLTYGINLSKRKTLANMYKDLVQFINEGDTNE